MIMNYDLAMSGYAAYGATTNFKNYQGLLMPEWNALPQAIKDAWYAAACAIREAARLADEA